MDIKEFDIPFYTQIFDLIPIDKIEAIVNKHNGDRSAKGFDTVTHFFTMLLAHISGANSIRDVIGRVAGTPKSFHTTFFKRIPTKSTLSYNNIHRDWKIFSDAFYMISDVLEEKLCLNNGLYDFTESLYSLDSTTINICLSLYNWANFNKKKGALKIHTLFDDTNTSCLPVFINFSKSKRHDIETVRTLSLPKNSIVAIDWDYVDNFLLHRWKMEEIFFVTLLKDGINYQVTKNLKIFDPDGIPSKPGKDRKDGTQPNKFSKNAKKKSNTSHGLGEAEQTALEKSSPKQYTVLKDQHIILTNKNAIKGSSITLRLVTVRDEEKLCILQILTNILDLPVKIIADIYRERWDVELFLKSIKENLNIKSFLGVSENAVRIQIYTAMIAILLIKYLQVKPFDVS
ncbi:MAG: IS4 family transposase [Deltaproteobacteria bacterium]|jgi:hypothetical protein|nr:IS4 family transposase [Deltaproteobacteria bacterium]